MTGVQTCALPIYTVSCDNDYAYIDGPGGHVARTANTGYTNGRTTGWNAAYGKYSATLSGATLTITRAGPTYNSEASATYGITGLETYSRAGQVVYQYVGGQYVSFRIPYDTQVGTARIYQAS